MTIWRTESTAVQELGQTHKRRPSGQRLKRGYAVRSIDAIAHSDQLPLRQAHAPNATGPIEPDGHHRPPSPGRSRSQPVVPDYPWRVLGLPWLHPTIVIGSAHPKGSVVAI